MSFIIYLARRWALDRNFFFFFYFDKIIPNYLESGGGKHKSQREIGKSLFNSLFKGKETLFAQRANKKVVEKIFWPIGQKFALISKRRNS